MKTVNLKQDMPTLEVARQRLSAALQAARREGHTVIKFVHGYGSTGAGGVLRRGIHASLRKRRKKGEIKAFIYGECFSVFDETTRHWIEEYPELSRDRDLERGNEGISIAIL